MPGVPVCTPLHAAFREVNVSEPLNSWTGKTVVLDLASPFVIIGVLKQAHDRCLYLADADVHDLRDTSTTRDLYVVDARRHGVNVNRKEVIVQRDQIVSLSLLEDVVV
jgi:hypothetical protein